MSMNKATYSIVLFTKQPKKDGTFPLKMRITYERKQVYYGVGLSYSSDEWGRIQSQTARGEYRTIKHKLLEIEKRAKEIIDHFETEGDPFSFQRFEELFFNQNNNTNFVFEALKAQIEEFKAKGRVSSAVSTSCALKSFETFFKKRPIRFSDVTPQVLSKYEDWMVDEQNNSVSTVGIYMRCIRALFNQQIAKGLLEGDKYPFGRYKYQIPAVEVRDKVISKEDLKKLFEYKPEHLSMKDKAKDLWFFLYLSNGMNVKDMCRLRFRNFKNGYFVFSRAKTEATFKQKKEITVIVSEEIATIIKKWGNEYKGVDCYVFPFYTEGISAADEYRITQNLTGVINDNMNKIATELELNVHITTYSARQTFSNVLLNSDAPIKLISDSLGHANSAITEKHYLKKVSLEKQKQFNSVLLNFEESAEAIKENLKPD